MQPGEKLAGRYQVVKILGSGGFGTTYLAQDTQRPGQPACVVKHLKPDNRDEFVVTTARRLFNSEAEILEKLGKHDQIPALLAYFEENGEFYLVQEFIEGHPLSQEIQRGAPWPQEKVVKMLADVLGTLEFVHRNGVIHRDIKPDNLIRRKSDGKLVLIDFGAVKQIQDPKAAAQQRTGATVAIGTVGYAPAEQAQGKPQFASDIYSLGIVAICALTGKDPDQLESDPQTGEIVWRQGVTVSHALATLLDRMVRYQYSRRYAHAGEALAAMRSLGLLGTTATPSGESSPSRVTVARPPTQARRTPLTQSLAPGGGGNDVLWKYGIITVLLLGMMGAVSLLAQSFLNQPIQVRRPEPTPASPEPAPTPARSPRLEPSPQRLTQKISLAPNGSFETEQVLQATEVHIYRFSADPTAQPLQLVLQVRATGGITATLLDPRAQTLSQGTSITYDLEEAGEYQVQLQGGQGKYHLRLELVALSPSPTPLEPEKKEEDQNPTPTLPGLPRSFSAISCQDQNNHRAIHHESGSQIHHRPKGTGQNQRHCVPSSAAQGQTL
ncbi:protein kinase domain-containing protein [Gloeomargarita sp.]